MAGFFERLRGGRASRTPQAGGTKNAPLVAFTQPGLGFFSDRAGPALVHSGFHRNAIVYRCVRLVSEAAASLVWTLLRDGKEAPGHPLESLLARPNPRDSGATLLEALYGHLLLSGNAFCEVIAPGEVPMELHALRPDKVRIVQGADGWPEAYDYQVGARVTRFPVGEERSPILHLRLFDPLDEINGYAPLGAAQMALEMHEAATRWNKALLDNSARPSGALVYGASEIMTDTQFDRL